MERQLPSHPNLVCTDPLYVTGESFPTDWAVFRTYISTFRENSLSLGHLPTLIEDLVYSLHAARADTRYLNHYIRKHYSRGHISDANALLDQILYSALALPDLFPGHAVPHISEKNRASQMSRAQIRCLVAHQLLGTIRDPIFETESSLTCWYKEHPAQPRTAHGYLASLFHYFLQPIRPELPSVMYELLSVPPPPLEGYHWLNSPGRIFDMFIFEPAHPSIRQFPHPTITCTIISCADSPSHGPTGTDEEIACGTWPELLPLGCLFVSKPIPILSAIFATGLVTRCAWEGFGTKARPYGLVEDYSTSYSCLFIDHPEPADTPVPETGLIDLAGGNLYRIICKAFAGISSLREHNIDEAYVPISGPMQSGQDPIVKILAWCIVSAFTGTRLHFSIDEYLAYTAEDSMRAIDTRFLNVIHIFNTLVTVFPSMSVSLVWHTLNSEAARECTSGWHVAQLLIFAANEEHGQISAVTNPYDQF
jgi:hypothetical protein